MKPEQDQLMRGWKTVAWVLVTLIVISLIPPVTVGGVTLRRANIFSDLYAFEEREAALMAEEPVLFDEAEFAVDLEAVTEQIEADTMPHEVQITYEWLLTDEPQPRTPIAIDTRRFASGFTPIEDFSDEGRFAAFCDTLLFADRTVRVAVLGDSFIEGDILTADLRERLQVAFGGRGTGFAPMASPLTAYRRTVKTQSKGWTSHNVMQHKSVPQPFNEQFFVSGWVCRPSEGASTRWEMTDYRSRLDSCSTGRVLFVAPEESHLTLTLNDSLRQEFVVEGAAAVRQAVVCAPEIRSLEVKVSGGVKTFVGYGALFESQGVTVDNYSVRSNNGQAIFRTNPSLNAQINTMLGYDLVILQYGLNIMQKGVLQYTSYGLQIEKIIAYVRQCFPSAAVLVLGVSDRSVKSEEGVETMDAIPYMIDCQRTAARNAGAAFWSTFDAMQAEGGIAEFVTRGWAAKDYTHINYAGGRRIAWALFDAINAEAAKADARNKARIEAAKPVIDSAMQLPVIQVEEPRAWSQPTE